MFAAVSIVLVSMVGGLATDDLGLRPVLQGPQWQLRGPVEERTEAIVEQWLLRAPSTNPGLLGLFERRDRLPRPEVVPWAGEFAGKYLIGAVQMLRLTENPALESEARKVAEALYTLQADDGYLGVFPEDDRLMGHWDLWNHYHVLLGLMLWGDYSGDSRPAETIDRALGKLWEVYGTGKRRPLEAGSPEVNFGIYHLLALLQRRAPRPQLEALIQIFEEDMTQAGDWLRLGAEGLPYWRLPKNGTRWESLHLVQGFYERFRDTGEVRYRDAFTQLWTSIRDFDRHPSGAFSTNESASGSVYRPGSIETCCSIAWMALTVDMLQLTGDSTVADELELTFWNEILAAHHPSGSWCTYHTPLNGPRRPAFHDINFQWRPGYPELNCCSANSPRGFSMLPDWGVIVDDAGVRLNYYGPSNVHISLPDHTRLELTQETTYPEAGEIKLRIGLPAGPREFALLLRIPAWTSAATVTVAGGPRETAVPGSYHTLQRTWADGDTVEIALDMTQRHWTGSDAYTGRAALYHGPLLLAYDPQWNTFDADGLLPIDVKAPFSLEALSTPELPGQTRPLILVTAEMENGATVRLCDFATAGATGTDLVAWLPAVHTDPPENRLIAPEDQAEAAPGPVLFRWGVPGTPETREFDYRHGRPV
jgi:hypothetical protein